MWTCPSLSHHTVIMVDHGREQIGLYRKIVVATVSTKHNMNYLTLKIYLMSAMILMLRLFIFGTGLPIVFCHDMLCRHSFILICFIVVRIITTVCTTLAVPNKKRMRTISHHVKAKLVLFSHQFWSLQRFSSPRKMIKSRTIFSYDVPSMISSGEVKVSGFECWYVYCCNSATDQWFCPLHVYEICICIYI